MGSSVRAAASKSAAPFMQSNEAAMAGSRCHAACLAAAHVPETKMHKPQLGPLLMPEMTRSGRLAGGGGGGLPHAGERGLWNQNVFRMKRTLKYGAVSESSTPVALSRVCVCVCVCVLPPSLRRPFLPPSGFLTGVCPRVHIRACTHQPSSS